jgi:hypothetical protein
MKEQARIEERALYLRGPDPAGEVVTAIKVDASRVKLTTLTAEKRIFGPGDKLVIVIRESGTLISEAAYQQLRLRLLK